MFSLVLVHLDEVSQQLLVLGLPALDDGVHLLDEVVGDALGDAGVPGVVRVRGDKVPHEARVGLEVAAGAKLEQLPVVGQGAHGRGADLLVAEELVDLRSRGIFGETWLRNIFFRKPSAYQRQEPWVLEARVPVDDLVHGHLRDLRRSVVRPARRRDVGAEEELLRPDGVAELRAPHVLVHLGDGDEEVVPEAEYDSGDEDDEADDGSVLEVGELQLARAELDAPTDGGLGRRRLRKGKKSTTEK